MRKRLMYSSLAAITLCLTACSGGDDSVIPVENLDSSRLLGKWVIEKAIYDSNADTLYYESNGSCGREVLEFYDDKEVSETFYVDEDCTFGGSGSYSWWSLSGGKFALGNENSFHHIITVTDNKLYLDGWEEGGFRKYYHKVN
ncbi:MAG: hypothetical protein DCE86_08930 [Flavobacteriaceae bacterium]|nr:MAG: hypothetical protein DCE86_08930 [Flavobacteriaceae bacterium]